jgi:hypothetical protein
MSLDASGMFYLISQPFLFVWVNIDKTNIDAVVSVTTLTNLVVMFACLIFHMNGNFK